MYKGRTVLCTGRMVCTAGRTIYDRFIRDNHFYPHTPSGEDDVKDIRKAKFFLRDCGYIKFRQGRYSITKKGSTLAESFYPVTFYLEILHYFVNKYNWLYSTRYNETMRFIQISAPFCFYIIKMKADNFISGEELGGVYLRAFPSLAEGSNKKYGNLMIVSGFSYIFIHEIAFYLGLLDARGGRKIIPGDFEYRSTDLFREVFQWKV